MKGISSDLPLAGLRILIVEDEYLLASALVMDLEKVGAVPIGPYYSVADALKLICDVNYIDAALLNFKLRGENSIPVANELRRYSIPFMFVSGNDDVVKAHFPDVPVHSKPADMKNVVRTLAAMIVECASHRPPLRSP